MVRAGIYMVHYRMLSIQEQKTGLHILVTIIALDRMTATRINCKMLSRSFSWCGRTCNELLNTMTNCFNSKFDACFPFAWNFFSIFASFHFRKMHFPYARTCYVYYEEKLSEYIEPIVNDVCKNLKRLSLPDDRYQPLPEHEEVNMGTTLFELYLVLKRFSVLGDLTNIFFYSLRKNFNIFFLQFSSRLQEQHCHPYQLNSKSINTINGLRQA